MPKRRKPLKVLERTAQGYVGFSCYVTPSPGNNSEPFVVVARTAKIAIEHAEVLAPGVFAFSESRCEKVLLSKAPESPK